MTDDLQDRLRHDLDGLHVPPGLAQALVRQRRTAQRRRRALAATGLVVALGGTALAITHDSAPPPDAIVPAVTAAPEAPRTGNQALVLRDGDRVTASSHVVQEAGKNAQLFCPGSFRARLPGYSVEPPLRACDYGVELVGFDTALISNRAERDGAVEGDTSVVGIWHDGSITVEEQGPPQRAKQRGFGVPPTLPCPTPEGGWPSDTGPVEDETNNVDAYRKAHPGVILDLYIGHPAPPADVLVLLIRSEADRAGIVRAFGPALGKNLCLAIADPSHAQAVRAQAEFRAGLAKTERLGNGLRMDYDAAGTIRGHFVIDGQYMTQAVADFADRYPADVVVLLPQIRPAP